MNNFKKARELKGESLFEVSTNLNIPYQTYRNYEIGKREPKAGNWKLFSDYFGVSINYLMGFEQIGNDMVSIPKAEYDELLAIKEQMEVIKEILR